MSGIGKGVTSASIGKILQVRGFRVTAIKIDPYLNVDAGTMNPYIHGEVFVTEDGGEADMDLGTYERFLDIDLLGDHNITTGQIYLSVIDRERRGALLGKCIQIIPHVADEIKDRIRSVASKSDAEVAVVEIGGTVGDIESLPYLEAARQMRLEEGFQNILYAHVTLVPVLDVVGEQKTKPTQHSVQELRRIGIQPDIIVARSREALSKESRRKIALFCNVEERAVYTSPDMRSIYESPLTLDNQGLGEYICERLELPKKKPQWDDWSQVVKMFVEPRYEVDVGICGKYAELPDCYVSVNEALKHAGAAIGVRVNLHWIETEVFEENRLKLNSLLSYDGVLVPGGFGVRGAEGKIAVINHAMVNNIPFLGICYGFQLSVINFARHISIKDANSSEIDPDTPYPVIDLMPEQKKVDYKGATMRLGSQEVLVAPNTLAHRLYGKERIYERHRHRYEVNPEYIGKLEERGLVFSGRSLDGRRMEILELPDKRFFLATQFHGEFKSRPRRPAPSYYGFIKACFEHMQQKKKERN